MAKSIKVSDEALWEAVEYYRENSFGYSSVEAYVRMDFYFVSDEKEIKRIIRFIKNHM